jgi:predicted O-methyltransferase YrrM
LLDRWAEVATEAVRDRGALQKPGELAQLLELLAEREPRVIVEIGSDAGGTLWAWSQLPGPPRVIGVDLPGGPYSSGAQLDAHGATVVIGNSHQRATLELVREQLAGDLADVLFVDGDHAYAGARLDYLAYRQLVRPGGLIVLHDVAPHDNPSVGVTYLWQEIAWRYPSTEIITEPSQRWAGIGVLVNSPLPAPGPRLLAAR